MRQSKRNFSYTKPLPTIMKISLTIIILLLFQLHIYGQDRMYVTAESGLIIRDKPSLESNKIYHLPNNTMVLISKKTGIKMTITDEGQRINGEWIKIRSFDNNDTQGYVFGGFLTTEKPEIWYSGKKAYYKTYDYDNQQDGTFVSRSLSKKYLNEKLPIVKPNKTISKQKKYPNFLNPYNKEIVLFENHDLNNLKPIGILNNLVQVQIDSTIYKYKYKDWTNCVWNRIVINNKVYYTDTDIHDYTLTKKLNELNQNVIIVGQDTGYDGAYHLGYPEYFFMIFTDNRNDILYRTEILDFYSGHEFAIEDDILNITWNDKDKSYEITLIGHKDKIRVNWNGKTSEIKKL